MSVEGEADFGARRLVLVHGRDQARRMIDADQKKLVDIAAEVMGDDGGRIGITYTGFCLTALPHKKLPDVESWEKRGHRVTLLIEPGKMKTGRGAATLYGVPYGARARMLLLFLQTEAVRTKSREIELGRSMRDWLGRMGLTYGGGVGAMLREQATRIAACSLKFFWEDDEKEGWTKGGFVRSGLRFNLARDEDRQDRFWEDRVVLDEVFYEALKRHPVPLREAALRQLSDRSTSLDLYVWLAYRLHNLKAVTPVRWAALREQFGSGYAKAGAFKRDFIKALAPAVAAYPEARVELADEGLRLFPSPPAVSKRFVVLGGVSGISRAG
jgi:hypothetical protein